MKTEAQLLREVREAQDEMNMLCEMYAQPGHCGITREDLVTARREIDVAIAGAGYFVHPCEGNTWRPRASARLEE